MEVKFKKCKVCKNDFKPFRTTDSFCSYDCASKQKSKQKRKRIQRIRPVSDKRKREVALYQKKRIEFLERPENKVCPINGKPTTDVHHKKGRIGKNYLDVSTWIALSRKGHIKVEENPEWAKENGYSENRL